MKFDQILLIVLFVIFAAAISVCNFLIEEKNKEKFRKILILILKISAIGVFSFYILRNMLNDFFIWTINGGHYDNNFYKQHNYLQSILRWSYLVSVCLLPTAAFYESKTLRRFAFYISLANVVLTIIYYNDYMYYFTSTKIEIGAARGIVTKPWFRHFEFDFEIIFMMVSTLIIGFNDNMKLLFKKGPDIVKFVVFLPTLFLVAIPVYLPQSLFGFTALFMSLFSPQHFIWLGGTVVLLLFIYFVFRDRSKLIKEIVVCYMALFLFQHYNSMYLMSFTASRLPFQLCNVGSYFALIAFVFHKYPKMQKFFDFIFIVNISGALFATIGFDLKEGLMSFWNVHYYLEHIWLFIIPFLMIAFGIFDLPDRHAFKHAAIGFTIYFACCAGFGLFFNSVMKDRTPFWNKCNYFYIFDDKTATDVFPFLRFVRKWSVRWNKYYFYPLLMIFVYGGFLPFSFIVFLINRKIILVGKDHSELRSRRHLLYKKEDAELC